MRSIFGVVYPIRPSLYALILLMPMSSPKITRMFGFPSTWAALAEATSPRSASASNAPRPESSRQHDDRPAAALRGPSSAGGGGAATVACDLSIVAAAYPSSEPAITRANERIFVPFKPIFHLLILRGHRTAEADARLQLSRHIIQAGPIEKTGSEKAFLPPTAS